MFANVWKLHLLFLEYFWKFHIVNPLPLFGFFSGILYFLRTASMGIYIEMSTAPQNTGFIRIAISPLTFLRQPPLDAACPLFKIFVFPPLFFVPPPFKVL